MPDYIDPAIPASTEPATPAPSKPASDVSPAPTVVTPEVSQVQTQALGVIIPSAAGRKLAYAVYAGLSLVVTNVAVAFSAIGANNPAWLTIGLAVIGNLAAPFGALAIANASTKK